MYTTAGCFFFSVSSGHERYTDLHLTLLNHLYPSFATRTRLIRPLLTFFRRCVLGEMFTRRPILPGTSDMDQLDKIWTLCGAPNQHSWPHYDELPGVTIEGAGSGAADGGVGGPGQGPSIIAGAAVKRFGFLGGVGGTKGKLRTVFVE